MEETDNQVLFELPVELELRKSAGGDRRIIRGYASTESMDQDGEVILQNGIDFSYLLKSGFLNYDHNAKCLKCGQVHDKGICPACGTKGSKMPLIIGYPISAEIRDKGLWVEGELLKSTGETASEMTKLADEMWELGLAFQKSGGKRSLCYSVEGGVLKKEGNRITRSIVRHLAVTTKPVNPEATIEVLRKSLCCGRCNPSHPLYIPGHTCGAHAPISKEDVENMQKALGTDIGTAMANGNSPAMRENLDRSISGVLYGDGNCGCCPDGKFTNGLQGAVEHLQKCQGYTKDQSIDFLRKVIRGAAHRPDLSALITQAGIVK